MQKKLKINRQNFHGEVLSGRIIKLIKLTQENIKLGKQKKGSYASEDIDQEWLEKPIHY